MEKREYLKKFRTFGGLMLFIIAFSTMTEFMMAPLAVAFAPILENEVIIDVIIELFSAIIFTYVYYIGYRIFIKKYNHPFMDFKLVKLKKIIPCIISCIFAIAIIRMSWYTFYKLIEGTSLHTNLVNTESEFNILSFIYAVIIAPILEEIVFRHWSLKLLKPYGSFIAIVMSSFGFSLIHLNLYQALPAFFIGLVLGYIAIKYNSIIPTIILHLTTNLLSTINITSYEEKYILPIMVIAIIGLILFIILNIKRILASFTKIPELFKLSINSMSLIIFTIIAILFIIITTFQLTQIQI